MNRIYKTKYNESLGAWVAVPEIAKRADKASFSNVISNVSEVLTNTFRFHKLYLALLVSIVGTNVYADTSTCIEYKGKTSGYTVNFECGPGSTTTTKGQASIKPAVAVGSSAKASGAQAVAFGSLVTASGVNATAIGNDSIAAGRGSVAFGGDDAGNNKIITDEADKLNRGYFQTGYKSQNGVYRKTASLGIGSTAVGSRTQALAKDSLAFGQGATAGKVKGGGKTSKTTADAFEGEKALALGANSWAQAERSSVMGANAQATVASSVAIGSQSVADRAALSDVTVSSDKKLAGNKVYAISNISKEDIDAIKNTVKGDWGAVSIGDTTDAGSIKTRQLTGLAAGSADTDAVNVAQLRSVQSAIDKGLTFTGDSGDTGIKKIGDKVAITGDSNITTKATTEGVQVTLNPELKNLTSVAVTGGPTINADGINMNGDKITGLAAGTKNGDAVNFGQFDALTTKVENQKTHYFHVNSTGGTNYDNNRAVGENAMAVGKASALNKNSIAIGNGAYVDKGFDEGDGIAIGTNARAVQPPRKRGSGFFSITVPHIKGSTAGIAIGKDTYASESTVDIGAKSVNNQTKGANRRGVTSVGADAFAAAHFSTITGSYSTIETNTDQRLGGFFSNLHSQGLGSTINGSLNTITANGNSGEAVRYDGIANAITGTANVIEYSNGALIMGAGNKISNSRKELVLNETPTFGNITDPNKLNEILNKRDSDGKKPELGSVGIFGGGNEVDRAYYSNIQGVDNALKGTDDTASQFVSIEGYRNQAENVEHLVTSGSFNKVTNGEENIVMGNYNELTGENADRSQAKRNVILGFQDKDANQIGKNISNNQIIGSNVTVADETTKGVLLGDDAVIEGNGAVALGAESVANRAALTSVEASHKAKSADNKVYALEIATNDDKQAIVDTVKGDLAAVSVGSADKTRQIINVAAGSDDTDAVNVAQLKAVANKLDVVNSTAIAAKTKVEAGKNIVVTPKEDKDTKQITYTVETADDVTFTSADIGGIKIADGVISNVKAGKKPTDAVNVSQLDAVVNQPITFAGDSGNDHAAKLGSTVAIKGADDNIQTKVEGNTIKVKLADNVKVVSLNAGDTVVNNEGVTIKNGPSITREGINAGGRKITGIADGTIGPNSKDAINGGQIYDLANGLNDGINKVDERASSGIASAMASAGLPQAYLPGKSLVAAGVGSYRGKAAFAVGVSTISDNGKWILKGTANVNDRDIGASVAVGYQW